MTKTERGRAFGMFETGYSLEYKLFRLILTCIDSLKTQVPEEIFYKNHNTLLFI